MTGRTNRVEDQAFVTLATNDSYALGALVLGHSLLRAGTNRTLACLITPGVTQGMRSHLSGVFDLVHYVDVLHSKDTSNLALIERPELGVTFTKLHCWRLGQFTKCVFMDADCLILHNIDELFEREELSAAPDIGWPDCFNSGVYVYCPSEETYQSLLKYAVDHGSFDGGDQGLLNTYFADWSTKDISRHLPFIYNMSASAVYTYSPAYKKFGKDVKVVHFLGGVKPWHHKFNTTTGTVDTYPGDFHAMEHLQLWWIVFMQSVQPRLEPVYVDVSSGMAALNVSGPTSAPPKDVRQWQSAWEQGHIDYLGSDAFDNILAKLNETMKK